MKWNGIKNKKIKMEKKFEVARGLSYLGDHWGRYCDDTKVAIAVKKHTKGNAKI